jgi:hypothetical protein
MVIIAMMLSFALLGMNFKRELDRLILPMLSKALTTC